MDPEHPGPRGMLTLECVTFRYPGASEPSLRDVSLSVGAGEVVGVVGASEAGKSTLCLVAGGLAPRATGGWLEGRLRVDGRDTSALPMHELAALVACGFADAATQLSLICDSVYEEVAFGPSNLGLPREEVIARADEVLARVGIEHLAERDPRRLSGGETQLVAISSLLVLRPLCLVLDEPTSHLDPAGTRMVMDTLGSLAAEGTTILLAEQRTDELLHVCDRVVVLDAGRVVMEGPARTVLADERLPGLGVREPSTVRLARLLQRAGLDPVLAAEGD